MEVSAAAIFMPLVHTEYPLAVMPSADSPQDCASGLYAVTSIRMVRSGRMGRPLNQRTSASGFSAAAFAEFVGIDAAAEFVATNGVRSEVHAARFAITGMALKGETP